jgi:hypothetical protein
VAWRLPCWPSSKIETSFQCRLRDAGPHADEEAEAEKEYERRQAQGWFGVLSDYTPLLEDIELTEDEHFVYVAHAVGLDWRGDLAKAAEHVKAEIERIAAITEYPHLGQVQKIELA